MYRQLRRIIAQKKNICNYLIVYLLWRINSQKNLKFS